MINGAVRSSHSLELTESHVIVTGKDEILLIDAPNVNIIYIFINIYIIIYIFIYYLLLFDIIAHI